MMRHIGILALAVWLVLFGFMPLAAAVETVNGDTTRTVTLAASGHDAYEVQTGGMNVAIRVNVSGSDVDFYVFTRQQYAEQYADYTNPNVPNFGFEESRENTRLFTHTITQSGLILVVDNDRVSVSGASPSGPVTYTLSFTYFTTNWALIIGVTVAILAAAIVGITLVVRRRRARAPMYAAPQVPSPYGPAPRPPYGMFAGTPTAPPAPPPAGPSAATGAGAMAPPSALDTRPCPNCGRPVPAVATFCPHCGANLR